MKYLPRSIYRWLPTLWVISGGLVGAYFPNTIGKASGLLLVFVGAVVFNMRLNNRG
jgi:hypothetical protein